MTPPHPNVPRVSIADDLVVQVMDAGRPALLACVRRAAQRDPDSVPRKVELSLDVDAEGRVSAVHVEVEDARLQACFIGVARSLRFPAPGVAATASLIFVAR